MEESRIISDFLFVCLFKKIGIWWCHKMKENLCNTKGSVGN